MDSIRPETSSLVIGQNEGGARQEPQKKAPAPRLQPEVPALSRGDPEPSCLSLRSDHSKQGLITFKETHHCSGEAVHQERPGDPEPSCLSLGSDHSKQGLITFKGDEDAPEQTTEPVDGPFSLSAQQPQSDLESIRLMIKNNMSTFLDREVNRIFKVLNQTKPERLDWQREDEESDGDDDDDDALTRSSREALLKITQNFLRKAKHKELADLLQSTPLATACQRQLKSTLKQRFQCLFQEFGDSEQRRPLNEIYTELYILEGGAGGVNEEHEVRQIQSAFKKKVRQDTAISCENIFEAPPETDGPVRSVLTKGVAGIGKTVLAQKFTLDWAEGQSNQDIQFLFPFTFRQLNLLKEKEFSLLGLVQNLFTETKAAGVGLLTEFQVLFIFDGLDECRLPLDFNNNKTLTDVTESSSVDVLLTSLIKGELLPSARLWITTRPAAANQIPAGCVDRVTEVRGFNESQREEYFRKSYTDEELASKVIGHVKGSRSLHIMCHIPVFCWITATVLEDMLKTRQVQQLPKTLTEMYIHFLVVQSKVKNIKYGGGAVTDSHWTPESRKEIGSLGKLAFEHLQKGNLIFYESDLRECGIDIRAAPTHSGVFTQIFKEERGLYQDKVFCFVHLSVQEFLAALHVHLALTETGKNLLAPPTKTSWATLFQDLHLSKKFYQIAVDMALESPNGHLDLFLRFLLGLSLNANQNLLLGLSMRTRNTTEYIQDTIQYVKKKISTQLSSERSINLFHCLNELGDRSFVWDIQHYLKSQGDFTNKLSSAQWSALVFILMSSEENLDVFDLKKYSASEDTFLRLRSVVQAARKALLGGCNLSERSCEALTSILVSKYSCLTELDLSNNNLQDAGVKLLCVGLQSPHCNLECLRLSGCMVTAEGCSLLASALKSNPSYLRELDLSYNHPGGQGLKLLAAGVQNPDWKLDTLRVDHGGAFRLKAGLKKYACELELDQNTAHVNLFVCENNTKVISVRDKQPYPNHPDRFDQRTQVLCKNKLSGRFYWEVERKREAYIAVTYRGIRRTGNCDSCVLGGNEKSWSLRCSENGYTVFHKTGTPVRHTFKSMQHDKIGVYLDSPAGTLSFYRVDPETLIHLHTFHETFTDPLYPAFGFGSESQYGCFGGSVALCRL